ncbi:YbaB/EbfC family nucleoid-associated protein [Prauserella cavernicola]|uniref:YbaB/EbfC family nucleoid-associated protein n=1 Tax=Prauserella cavernicola TaxID=2800127 RepID=A0A934V218_9PSEU|nr:YbaB/EbfC family nucleoid-associated protein [Prauserella cavernicola]MBK1784496.1 YbaB/EbfC family nucleoid-associated protein [Prauserella cavernicola]
MERSTSGVERARTQLGALVRRTGDARDELAAERFSYTSPDRLVTATVDGTGALVGLTIAEGTLHMGESVTDDLGSLLVTAVNTARRGATLDSRDRLASVIGGKRADALVGASEYDALLGDVEQHGGSHVEPPQDEDGDSPWQR